MGQWYRRARGRARSLLGRGGSAASGSPHHYLEVESDDPIAAVYAAEWRTVVIPVELERLRLSRVGVSVGGAHNPFVRTVQQLDDGTARTYRGSALEAHYAAWQPATVGELLGLGADAGAATEHPPASVALPWMAEAGTVDPAARVAYADRWARVESARAGRELDLAHGHKLFGPVSSEFGELEFSRYAQLRDSIDESGYVPLMDGEYVGVQILTDGRAWVALATGPGLHRAAAAAALGVDPLVVAIDKHPRVVARRDVEWWPGVQCGLYTRDGALAVFDRVLTGEPPAGFPA